jgi:hypothetical protein|tara:strand:- start:427 stop:744 length:318 start_codon:yes stop_codon:yes gene_type:complete
MKQQKENSSTDKRYTFAQRPGDDYSCIKIVEGKYKDVIYKYGKVQFAKEENADGKLPLQFEWTLLKKPEELDLDIDKEAFLVYIGDILIELLDERINDGTILDDK